MGKTMMRIVMAMVALVLAMGAAAPTLAQTDDDGQVMRGWMKDDGSQFVIVMEIDGEDTSTAKLMYGFMNDPALLEDEFGFSIVSEQSATKEQLRAMGADDLMLYAVVTEDTTPGLVVMARADEMIFMMVLVGSQSNTDLDAEMFAQFTFDVIEDGAEDVDGPDGYTEHDFDDDSGLGL